MSGWEDVTSYRRDEEHIPRWWQIHLGMFRLSVGNYHIHYREDPHWLYCFNGSNVSPLAPVGALTEAEAKKVALEIVRDKLAEACEAVLEALLEAQEAAQ